MRDERAREEAPEASAATPQPDAPGEVARGVRIVDGEVTVDAEVLAPRLGLTVDELRTGMANGEIAAVSETGVDEDAGRTRLTFRAGRRIWRVIVDRDGTLVPDPPVFAGDRAGETGPRTRLGALAAKLRDSVPSGSVGSSGSSGSSGPSGD